MNALLNANEMVLSRFERCVMQQGKEFDQSKSAHLLTCFFRSSISRSKRRSRSFCPKKENRDDREKELSTSFLATLDEDTVSSLSFCRVRSNLLLTKGKFLTDSI